MTQVLFAFVHPDGTPAANAGFSIHLRRTGLVPDGNGVVVTDTNTFVTGDDGTLLVELQASTSVYLLVMTQANDECGGIRYKFYVPQSDEIVLAQDLFLAPVPNTEPWDETAIRLLTEAKLAASASAAESVAASLVSQNAAETSVASALAAETSANEAKDYEIGAAQQANLATDAAAEAKTSEIAAAQSAQTAGSAAEDKVNKLAEGTGSKAIGHTDGGLAITLSERLKQTPAAAADRAQARLMVPFFGFNNGVTNTNLFPGASNAFQGISILNEGGVDYVYVAIRVSGGSWTTAERCRLCRFPLKTDATSYDSIVFTRPLAIGHGADLSARMEGGQVFLYTSHAVTDSAEQGTNAGKGYAKITWKGAATAQSDIVSHRVFGLEGSGHKFAAWNRATVAISDDRRWLLLATAPISQAYGRQVAVYDFAAVEALADKTQATPEYIWTMTDVKDQGGNVVQGMCSDGHTIYMMMGGTDVFGQNFVVEYSLDGNLLRNTSIDGPAAHHGLDGLLNNPLGFPWRIEPEGICMYKGGVVVTFAEGWYAGGKVVSKYGENWACIGVSNTTGVPPANRGNFSRTSKAVTDGEWSNLVDYRNTTPLSDATKTLYYLGSSLGLPQETGPSQGILDQMDPSAVSTGQGSNATSVGLPYRGNTTFREWSSAYRTYFDRMILDSAGRLRLHDTREGSDIVPYVSIQSNFTPDMRAMVLRASGTSASDSAWHRLHATNCPLYPSAIVEGAGPLGSIRRVTDQYGATKFNSSAGYTPITSDRPDSGRAIRVMRNGVDIGGLSQNTAALKVIAAEGLNVRVSTTTDGAETDGWEMEATALGWRPATNLLQKLGQLTRMCLEVWSKFFMLGDGVFLTSYAGTPETFVTAKPGSLCVDTVNGVVYVKNTGTAAIGWKLITQSA